MRVQDNINKINFNADGFENLGQLLIPDLYQIGILSKSGEDSALRDRYYATGEHLCEKNTDFPYSLTVVGHSPSQGNYRATENLQLKDTTLYGKCDTHTDYKGRGCIVFKCPHHDKEMPRIVLVDTALSESLTNNGGRTQANEETRSIEFLHLTHEDKETKSYFNRMYKYLINNKDKKIEDDRVYPKIQLNESVSPGCGSLKQKYLTYKAKYIKLKDQIQF
jgi:hypothetical protein